MFSKSVINAECNIVFTFINYNNLMLLNSLIVCNKNDKVIVMYRLRVTVINAMVCVSFIFIYLMLNDN